jgi:hypothetical protein
VELTLDTKDLELFHSKIARGPIGRIQARLPRVLFVGQIASGRWYSGQDLLVLSQMDEGGQDNQKEQNRLSHVNIPRYLSIHTV